MFFYNEKTRFLFVVYTHILKVFFKYDLLSPLFHRHSFKKYVSYSKGKKSIKRSSTFLESDSQKQWFKIA